MSERIKTSVKSFLPGEIETLSLKNNNYNKKLIIN